MFLSICTYVDALHSYSRLSPPTGRHLDQLVQLSLGCPWGRGLIHWFRLLHVCTDTGLFGLQAYCPLHTWKNTNLCLQVMQSGADSATQIITQLRAELAAMTSGADAAKLQLTRLTSEASALRRVTQHMLSQQLRQQINSLRAELEGMANKIDAPDQLRAVAQVVCLPTTVVCPYFAQANPPKHSSSFPHLPLPPMSLCPPHLTFFVSKTQLVLSPSQL